MKLLSIFVDHYRNCRSVRRLLRDYPGGHLDHLYWYDMPLRYAISWKGIFKTLKWFVQSDQGDPIAANYNISYLYYRDVTSPDPTESAAGVWQCKSLNSIAWPQHDERGIADTLERHAESIINEYREYQHQLDLHPDNPTLTETGRWDGLFLYDVSGRAVDRYKDSFKSTYALIDELPICTTFGFVAFSSLEPGTRIYPHAGSSNLRLRYHLGVDVPEPQAARIRVGDEWRHWQQARVIFFDDSFSHEVVHNGDLPRAVLIVDTWHPSLTEEDIRILSHPVFSRFGKMP